RTAAHCVARRRMNPRRGSACAFVLAAAASAAGTAFAQSAPPVDEPTLEEVLVTAQKRAQPVQAVPSSISVFVGDRLERTGAGSIEDVAHMAPDFTVGHGSQQTNSILSIRGIGSVGNSAIESSVAVFIDGVYYPRPGSVIGLLSDVK